VSASERSLLSRVAGQPMTMFVVLNKADHLDPARLATVTEFTRRAADLTRSAITQARRIARARLADVAVARSAARTRATDTAARAGESSTQLAAAAKSIRDGVTVVNGESARLLFALNDAADADVARLRSNVAGRLDAVLDSELSAASPVEIGRAGPGRLDRRLAGDLAAQLDTLRDSAAELLGLDLAQPDPDGRLARTRWPAGPDTGAAGPPGLNLPGAHHAMPGERGRRRARQHLHDQIPGLVTTELETACTGLRNQLATATRALAAAVARRSADAADRIQAARRAAEDLRQSAAAEARRAENPLAAQERALRHVLALLDGAATDNPRC